MHEIKVGGTLDQSSFQTVVIKSNESKQCACAPEPLDIWMLQVQTQWWHQNIHIYRKRATACFYQPIQYLSVQQPLCPCSSIATKSPMTLITKVPSEIVSRKLFSETCLPVREFFCQICLWHQLELCNSHFCSIYYPDQGFYSIYECNNPLLSLISAT